MSEFDNETADVSAVLDAYMYLDYQYKSKGKQEENLNEILEKIEDDYKDNEYYKVLKKACEVNPSLGEYTLVSQSHYDHETNGQDFFNYTGEECTDDPIQACAFKSPDGDLYVAYRGTGSKRWGDNGQGFVDESTDMQEAARAYFDHVVEQYGYEGNLYVTGHSKGGNEAQYVMMTSEHRSEITACYSIEGQGFSDRAIERFKKDNQDYEEILGRMFSINSDMDPVHKLIGVIIPEENTYYVNTHYEDSDGKKNYTYVHDVRGIIQGAEIDWQRDEDGNITHGTEGWLSRLAGILNDNLQKLPEDKKGACAIALMETIDLLQGGSMDDATAFRSDYAVLEIIGIPLITASAMEYVLIAAYEKNGAVGALAAVILEVSFLQTIVFGDVLLEALVKIADGANYIMNMIDAVEQIIDKAKELCTGAGAWMEDALRELAAVVNNIRELLYTGSSGYRYAAENPYLEINTTSMREYAATLSALSTRAKNLDSSMNSLYRNLGIDWSSISNLAALLKAEIVLDFANRLDKCVEYMNQTATDFENVENELVGSL